MVKCTLCVLSHELRYSRPPGVCEHCGCVTPYQDKLCGACSDATQKCAVCRSHRVSFATINFETQENIQQLVNNPSSSSLFSSPSASSSGVERGSPSTGGGGGGGSGSLPNMQFQQTSNTNFSSSQLVVPPHAQSLVPHPSHSSVGLSVGVCSIGPSAALPLSPSAPSSGAGVLISSPSFTRSSAAQPDYNRIQSALASRHDVLMSPSGQLVAVSLAPLTPAMAVKHNANAAAPHIHSQEDALQVVQKWSRAELVHTIFHYYCNWKSSKLTQLLPLSRYRHFCSDSGLLDGAALSSSRVDLIFSQAVRQLSGNRQKMNEEQFFEALGLMAAWKYSRCTQVSSLSPDVLARSLKRVLNDHLVPLAVEIVTARRCGLLTRNEPVDPICTNLFLKYEAGLKRIFVLYVRKFYTDAPCADERFTHPLIEEGWKGFLKDYDFFPRHLSVSDMTKIFINCTTGMIQCSAMQLPAMSYQDFIHALYQLAAVAFQLTPHALALERVELLLNKIDGHARELDYIPVAHASGAGAARVLAQTKDQPLIAADSKALTVQLTGSHDEQVEKLVTAQKGDPYAALHELFTPAQMSCARDLFNVYCNTATQCSYTEMLNRVQWARLLRDSLVFDRSFPPPDGDIIYNKVLAASQQSQSPHAVLFQNGRFMVFNQFLSAITEVAHKKFPTLSVYASMEQLFSRHFHLLLNQRVAELQAAQREALPLGLGVNGQLLLTDGRTDEKESQQQSLILYPNHPTASHIDAKQLLQEPDVKSLFEGYSKGLHSIFWHCCWDGVEHTNGLHMQRLHTALPLSSKDNSTAQPWENFLQNKNLLNEHNFRKWCQVMKIVPQFITHKQVTMLFRDSNIGFDRDENQFVMNFQEFEEILLRIALIAFSGASYQSYRSAASKLELLIFLLDSETHSLGFRTFRHSHSRTDARDGAYAKMPWDRQPRPQLNVKDWLIAIDQQQQQQDDDQQIDESQEQKHDDEQQPHPHHVDHRRNNSLAIAELLGTPHLIPSTSLLSSPRSSSSLNPSLISPTSLSVVGGQVSSSGAGAGTGVGVGVASSPSSTTIVISPVPELNAGHGPHDIHANNHAVQPYAMPYKQFNTFTSTPRQQQARSKIQQDYIRSQQKQLKQAIEANMQSSPFAATPFNAQQSPSQLHTHY